MASLAKRSIIIHQNLPPAQCICLSFRGSFPFPPSFPLEIERLWARLQASGFPPLSLFPSGNRKTMDATTLLRPPPSFLQPTSKPKGVAAGRNLNPFVSGRSRRRWSAPRSWTRQHQANTPFSILALLMMLPSQPRMVLPLHKRHRRLQQTCSAP